MLKVSQLHGFNVAAQSPFPLVTYSGSSGAFDINSGGFSLDLNLSAAVMDCLVAAVSFGANANRTFNAVTLNGDAADGSITAFDNNDADRAGLGIFWWLAPDLINPNPLFVQFSGATSGWALKVIGLTGVNQSIPTVVTATSTTNGSASKSINLDTTTGGNTKKTTIIGARALARGVTGITQSSNAGVTQIIDLNTVDQVTMFVGKAEGISPGTFSFGTTASGTAPGDAMAAVAFRS